MNSKSLTRIFGATAILLLIPLIAMQFSEEVDWNLFDFIVMGFLLFMTGTFIEYTACKINNKNNRVIAVMIIMGVFLLIWAELAVGIFGTPFAGS